MLGELQILLQSPHLPSSSETCVCRFSRQPQWPLVVSEMTVCWQRSIPMSAVSHHREPLERRERSSYLGNHTWDGACHVCGPFSPEDILICFSRHSSHDNDINISFQEVSQHESQCTRSGPWTRTQKWNRIAIDAINHICAFPANILWRQNTLESSFTLYK